MTLRKMNEIEPKKAKKKKRNIKWHNDPSNSGWSSKVSFNTARYTVCNVSFTVKYDGIKAVTAHRNSEKHKALIRSDITSHTMSGFYRGKQSQGIFSNIS